MSDGTVAHRVLALPELLRDVLFSLPKHRDPYHAALVCRTWSECALDVLWYQVEDVCILFNLLVPLTKAATSPSSKKVFVRCPRPEDWVNFEKYSQRVKKMNIGGTSELPAQSVFDDIARSRIQHTIFPNMWSFRWFAEPLHSAIFLHAGIRDMLIWLDVNFPDQVEAFMHNARFFSRNVVRLEIQVGFADDPDPHPVSSIVTELVDWLVQLPNLRELSLPMFWITTQVFQVLSQLNHLTKLKYKYDPRGYGSPLDTFAFSSTLNPEIALGSFPSLTNLTQSAPFSGITPYITSCQSASRLTALTICSQKLESPSSFRSLLNAITSCCPLLSDIGLMCLVTPYRHDPEASNPSETRITLDDLLSLEKLTHLESLEITHALPLAVTDDEFAILVSRLSSKLIVLHLGSDPYPLDNEVIHTIESPLSPSAGDQATVGITRYPIPGLWQSMKSLREHCPNLQIISIFGIDDFTVEDNQDDEPLPLQVPFPDLEQLSFGTSLLTSDKMAIVYALSQYLLPDVKFSLFRAWGADEASAYLTYLNLKPLFPIRDELSPALQTLIDAADPDVPNTPSSKTISSMDVDEPLGVNGVVDEDTRTKLEERGKPAEEIRQWLNVMSRARLDERKNAERRLGLA